MIPEQQAVEFIQGSINEVLIEFLHKPVTASIKEVIKYKVQAKLMDMVACGEIAPPAVIPIVDVNDEQELVFLNNKYEEIRNRIIECDDDVRRSDLEHPLFRVGVGRNKIKEDNALRDPTRLDVNLKVPVTFEAWSVDQRKFECQYQQERLDKK